MENHHFSWDNSLYLAVQDLTFNFFKCSLPFDHSFLDVIYGKVAVQPPAMSSFSWDEEIAKCPGARRK